MNGQLFTKTASITSFGVMSNIRYFHYQRGGWLFCVLAVSKQDAEARKNLSAPDAQYLGEWYPPQTIHSESIETGMISEKAQMVISEAIK